MSLLIPEIIMLGTRLMNANCSYQYGSNNSFNKYYIILKFASYRHNLYCYKLSKWINIKQFGQN